LVQKICPKYCFIWLLYSHSSSIFSNFALALHGKRRHNTFLAS